MTVEVDGCGCSYYDGLAAASRRKNLITCERACGLTPCSHRALTTASESRDKPWKRQDYTKNDVEVIRTTRREYVITKVKKCYKKRMEEVRR